MPHVFPILSLYCCDIPEAKEMSGCYAEHEYRAQVLNAYARSQIFKLFNVRGLEANRIRRKCENVFQK